MKKDEDNIPIWVQDLLKDEDKFWMIIYPAFSFEEKVKYWSGVLFRKMRWQAESGLDPYAIYNKEWYENTKASEPKIDEIMNNVFEKYWKDVWNKEEYQKRIS